MSRTRVLLADDHEEFLEVEAKLLEPEFDVTTTARDGKAAFEETTRLRPDILVLDITMPIYSGMETARLLRAAGSLAKVVFLTVHGDPDFVRAGFEAGASGYVVKSRLAADLIPALREVAAGRQFVSASIYPE